MPLTHWRGDDFVADIEAALEINLVSTGVVLAQRMKGLAPVRTGALRDSIDSEADGLSARVGSTLDYALDVEFGTATEPAHPFIVPALDQNARDIADIILTDVL